MDDGPEVPTRVYRSGTFRALGLCFAVRSTDEALGSTVDRLLAAMADRTHGPIATVYTLTETGVDFGRPRFSVLAGDDLVGETATSHGAVSLLLWDINRRAVISTPDHFLLHAAAVSYRGSGILLPGPSGAGKTTLAAGLVYSGMEYLTDEVAAFDPLGWELIPFPKPLTIERGSLAALAELGMVDPRPDAGDETPWHLEASRLGGGAVGNRCRPQFVVVHRFVPDAATRLVPLRRSGALVALAENSFQPLHRRPGSLEALAGLVRECECLELTVGNLGDACMVLADHVDSTLTTAAR